MQQTKVMEDVSSMHNVMCVGRCVRACTRLSEAAKAQTPRDHVRGIGGPSTLLNIYIYISYASCLKRAITPVVMDRTS
jgi:hypothetical protein